jgi:hypothetical protein
MLLQLEVRRRLLNAILLPDEESRASKRYHGDDQAAFKQQASRNRKKKMERMERMFFWIMFGMAAGEMAKQLLWRRTPRLVTGDLTITHRHLRQGDGIGQIRPAAKLLVLLAFVALASAPLKSGAQIILPIGTIIAVADSNPTVWGMSGMEMVKVTRSIGNESPVSRTMAWDARTVEILSRTQAPPLSAKDVKIVAKNGRQMVVVRRYLLMEVMDQDAQAAGTSKSALAETWATAIRKVLPAVAPLGSRFGI